MKWPAERDAIRHTYQADGFAVIREFLSHDQVAEVKAQVDHYIHKLVPDLPEMDVFSDNRGDLNSITMLSRMDRHAKYFHDMLVQPPFHDVPEYLWSCGVSGHDTALFNKPPLSPSVTPPHQDGYYFHLTPCEATTLWLALDPVHDDNGCLRYSRGSHKRGLRPHGRSNVLGFSQTVLDYTPAEQEREIAVHLEPGDMIVHDGLTIHRAGANRSADKYRRALGLVYFSERAAVDHAAANAYQAQLKAELSSAGKI